MSFRHFTLAFSHCGHIQTLRINKLDDNDYIQHKTVSLFTRCNMLIARFSKCTVAVKCILFQTYCLCMYQVATYA